MIEDDLDPQIGWRRVQAKLLAQRGDFAEAERLGREAAGIAERTDFLDHRARAHEDLAEVLRLAGQHEAASAELDSAIRLHDQKGNLVSAARAMLCGFVSILFDMDRGYRARHHSIR